MLRSYRPYAPVLGGDALIKGASLLQAPGQWPYWAQFWQTWDTALILKGLDALASVGGNCVQITATGVVENSVPYPSDEEMQAKVDWFCVACAERKITVNPQLGWQPAASFGSTGAKVAEASVAAGKIAKMFARHSNISFIDLMNEYDLSLPSGWSLATCADAMRQMALQVRPVSRGIPLTASLAMQSAWYSGSQLVAGFCDMPNLHIYQTNGSFGATVPSSVFTPIITAPWYKGGFVIGEFGISSALVPDATARQTWFASIGPLMESMKKDLRGVIVWGLQDTTGPGVNNGFGMWDSTITTPRTDKTIPFAAWPARM